MVESRKRRIVKWVVRMGAAIVVLLCLYVWSYFGVGWLVGSGRISFQQWEQTKPPFAPLSAYTTSDLPGAVEFHATFLWFVRGGQSSWAEEREAAQNIREMRKRKRESFVQPSRRS